MIPHSFSLQKAFCRILGTVAVMCIPVVGFMLLIYSVDTETTGHLWWKESRTIPMAERLPYLWAAIGTSAFAVACATGSIILYLAYADAWKAARRTRLEAERAAAEYEMAAQREAVAKIEYDHSTEGRAIRAYQSGERYFSIDLAVDGQLADHLNVISAAGWLEESVHYTYRWTSQSRPGEGGGHDVTKESVKYATYLFRRSS